MVTHSDKRDKTVRTKEVNKESTPRILHHPENVIFVEEPMSLGNRTSSMAIFAMVVKVETTSKKV